MESLDYLGEMANPGRTYVQPYILHITAFSNTASLVLQVNELVV